MEECSDTPEGLQLFSKGVDISVFYLDDSRTTGFREPVFDFSCTALEDLNGTVESGLQLEVYCNYIYLNIYEKNYE